MPTVTHLPVNTSWREGDHREPIAGSRQRDSGTAGQRNSGTAGRPKLGADSRELTDSIFFRLSSIF